MWHNTLRGGGGGRVRQFVHATSDVKGIGSKGTPARNSQPEIYKRLHQTHLSIAQLKIMNHPNAMPRAVASQVEALCFSAGSLRFRLPMHLALGWVTT